MPAGSATLAAGRQRLQSREGWPAGLTVLTGTDLYHLEQTQKEILQALVPGEDAFALTVFGDDPVDAGVIVAAARSAGMFAPRRVVLVRDVAAIALDSDARVEDACDTFTAYDASPPAGSHLIVRAPKLDVRRRFHKVLAAARVLLEFAPPRLPDLEDEIDRMASQRGIELTREAAGLLLQRCIDLRSGEGDLTRAAGELDKLAAWLGPAAERTPVEAPTVAALAAGGGGTTPFQVVDAVASRDAVKAQRLARELMDGGESPLLLLGALAWRCRGLLQAKAMLAARAPERAVQQATRVWNLDVLRRWRLDELTALPAALLRADRSLKTGAEPRAVMQRLIATLSERP